MYCKNCGNSVNNQTDPCPNCGSYPLDGDKFCQNCGTATSPGQEFCMNCGANLKDKGSSQKSQTSYSSDFSSPAQSNYSEEKSLAMLAHILALITGFVGPLIIYLVTEPNKPFQKDHAREALNFQLTLLIALFVSGILSIILIGFLGFIVFGIMDLIFCITAAIRANDMQNYRYPVSIRFLK